MSGGTKPVPILFVDVDGVLAPLRQRGLCGDCLDRLGRIVEASGCDIVLSSTWRRLPHKMEQLGKELRDRCMIISGTTPELQRDGGMGSVPRGLEIALWLDDHLEGNWQSRGKVQILDDEGDMGPLWPLLVRCDGEEGLTDEVADRVIRRFKSA